jgi:hypothetical protein
MVEVHGDKSMMIYVYDVMIIVLLFETIGISYLIFSFLNDKRLLAPKYSEYFT